MSETITFLSSSGKETWRKEVPEGVPKAEVCCYTGDSLENYSVRELNDGVPPSLSKFLYMVTLDPWKLTEIYRPMLFRSLGSASRERFLTVFCTSVSGRGESMLLTPYKALHLVTQTTQILR